MAHQLDPPISPKIKKNCVSKVYIFVEARAVHRVAEDGSLVRADAPPPCDEKLDLPLSVTGIATDVLNSGIAIYPGKPVFYLLI